MSSREEGGLAERLQAAGTPGIHAMPTGPQVGEFAGVVEALVHEAGRTTDAGSVVVFAATRAGEGASYVSYNCARILSQVLGGGVAWVDANFRNPHRVLAEGHLALADLVADPDGFLGPERCNAPLTLITCAGMTESEARSLGAEEYARLLTRLRAAFEFTVIDAPPILEGGGVARFARGAAGLVVVVESQGLKHEVVRHGLEKLAALDIRILGTVLNKRRFELPGFLYKRI